MCRSENILERPRWRHRAHYHACCWMWKVAFIVPVAAALLHFFGIPHPEALHFVP